MRRASRVESPRVVDERICADLWRSNLHVYGIIRGGQGQKGKIAVRHVFYTRHVLLSRVSSKNI